MSRPQVFVYLDADDKEIVSDVADRLGMKEAALFRALALPYVYQVYEALEKGANPVRLRHKIRKRMEG